MSGLNFLSTSIRKEVSVKSEEYHNDLSLAEVQVDASALARGIYRKYAGKSVSLQTIVAAELLLLNKVGRLVSGDRLSSKGLIDRLKESISAGDTFLTFLTSQLGIEEKDMGPGERDLTSSVYEAVLRGYRSRFTELALRSEVNWDIGIDWKGSFGIDDIRSGMKFIDAYSTLVRTSMSSAEYMQQVQSVLGTSEMAKTLFDLYNRRREGNPYTLSVPGDVVLSAADSSNLIMTDIGEKKEKKSGVKTKEFSVSSLSFYDILNCLEQLSEDFVFGPDAKKTTDVEGIELIRRNPSLLSSGVDLMRIAIPDGSTDRIDKAVRQFSVDWYVDLIINPRTVSKDKLDYMKLDDTSTIYIHNLAQRICQDILELIQGTYTSFLELVDDYKKVPSLDFSTWHLGLTHLESFHKEMFKYNPNDVDKLFTNITARYTARAATRSSALGEMFTSLTGPISYLSPVFVDTSPLSQDVVSSLEYRLSQAKWNHDLMSGYRYKLMYNCKGSFLPKTALDVYRTYPSRLVDLSGLDAVNSTAGAVTIPELSELIVKSYESQYSDIGEMMTSLFVSPAYSEISGYGADNLFISDNFVRIYSPEAVNAIIPRVPSDSHVFVVSQLVQMADFLGIRGIDMFETALKESIGVMSRIYKLKPDSLVIVGRFSGSVSLELLRMNMFTKEDVEAGYNLQSFNGKFYIPPHDIQRLIGNGLRAPKVYIFSDSKEVTTTVIKPNVEMSKRPFDTTTSKKKDKDKIIDSKVDDTDTTKKDDE